MQPSIRLMRHALGLGLSALLMVGCQDMLGENQRQSTNQDMQVNAQQGVSDEKTITKDGTQPKVETKVTEASHQSLDTVAACKELHAKLNSPEIQAHPDLYLEAKNRFSELNCFAVVATVDPTTPPREPNMEEVCHNLKATLGSMGTDNPKYPYYLADYQKHCMESKVTVDMPSCDPKTIEEKPVVKEEVPPKEEPKISEEHPAFDTLAQCRELEAKLNNKEISANVEVYMQVKNQFTALNCFAVIGNAKPTIPPKEPTHEEVCANLKSSIEAVTKAGTDPVKLESLKAAFHAQCTEPAKPVEPPKAAEPQPEINQLVATCTEIRTQMLANVENVEVYMKYKYQFGDLGCMELIGMETTPPQPPKELTQDEVCANLKSSMELLTTLGTDPTKLETYKIEYQAHCVAH